MRESQYVSIVSANKSGASSSPRLLSANCELGLTQQSERAAHVYVIVSHEALERLCKIAHGEEGVKAGRRRRRS